MRAMSCTSSSKRRLALLLTVCTTALGACGGGGERPGMSSSAPPVAAPAPTPAPASTPAPTPKPTASIFSDDTEYNQSNAAAAAGALSAYDTGARGAGVKIAIVDSGINTGLAEFAGRVDAGSQNVKGGGAVSASGYHGTSVAAVAAAARDGSGIMGVAPQATILALNSASDCTAGKCNHYQAEIARGVDLARTNGARVINISLNGEAPDSALVTAVSRATQAGIVIVFAAGNSGQSNPDPLGLQAARQAGNGLAIIAGALGQDGNIASFSNQAGSGSAYYLMALGEGVRSIDDRGQTTYYNGTSYSAPVISGAVALLAGAFPNLSGAQIVEILYRSADDLGAPGIDATYGRGRLNLARAFQPQGATSLAGSHAPVAIGEAGQGSAAMGDAVGEASFGAVILDGYSRAFAVDFAARLARAAEDRPLAQALHGHVRSAAGSAGPVSVALTVTRNFTGQPEVGLAQTGLGYEDAREAKALAGYAVGRLSPRTALAFGFSDDAHALQQRLAGSAGDAFLVAREPMSRHGFAATPASSLALRHELGRIGLTVGAEKGAVWDADQHRAFGEARYDVAALTADRRVGPALLSLGATRLHEQETVLGGRLGSAFASGGATSWFVDAGARIELGGDWTGRASYRRGWTEAARLGPLATDGGLESEAWSFDLATASAFAPGDRLALRVMQPLRVTGGGFALNLPTSYDYASGTTGFESRFFGLAPSGREIDVEAAYSVGLWGGALGFNAYMRRQPGHIAAADEDVGAALRYSLDF